MSYWSWSIYHYDADAPTEPLTQHEPWERPVYIVRSSPELLEVGDDPDDETELYAAPVPDDDLVLAEWESIEDEDTLLTEQRR